MNSEALLWQETSRKDLLECRIFTATERHARSAAGIESAFVVLEAPDWASVIPLVTHEGRHCFLMVRQFRHGSAKVSLEFPGGVVDPGEDPADAAKRELLEETGHRPDRVLPLGSVNPNPAFMNNKFHVFLAEGLVSVAKQDLDHDEVVHFEYVPVEDAERVLLSDPDAHALMLVALFRYREYMKEKRKIHDSA